MKGVLAVLLLISLFILALPLNAQQVQTQVNEYGTFRYTENDGRVTGTFEREEDGKIFNFEGDKKGDDDLENATLSDSETGEVVDLDNSPDDPDDN